MEPVMPPSLPSLFYPVKDPMNLTNLFGAQSAMYSGLGLKGHPGQDYESVTGTPIYAPCDGDALFASDQFHGDGLWIRYPNNAAATHTIILYHMPEVGTPLADRYPFKVSTVPGTISPIKAGQLLGYTDNSGAPTESSGPHLHVAIFPCDATGEAISPQNGYLGCIDPAPFWNGKFAEDINTVQLIVPQVELIANEIQSSEASDTQKSSWLDVIQKVVIFLQSLLP